jgi:hypothetical protein
MTAERGEARAIQGRGARTRRKRSSRRGEGEYDSSRRVSTAVCHGRAPPPEVEAEEAIIDTPPVWSRAWLGFGGRSSRGEGGKVGLGSANGVSIVRGPFLHALRPTMMTPLW